MHISNVKLRNFKRFTDLSINLSQPKPPPKLVLLIGANGSGKSSVFDAFEVLANGGKDYFSEPNFAYYSKSGIRESYDYAITIQTDQGVFTINDGAAMPGRTFYGRSSLRQTPVLSRTSTQDFDLTKDTDRPRHYIDRDKRFENDIEILTRQILEEVFNGGDFDAKKLKERYLQPINQSLFRIFSDLPAPLLELVSLKPPLGGSVADIRFKKGISEIHYNLLSAGEKEVINLLINLFVRRDTYQDTIYFIDELDLHLNTRLQYNLLKEITEHWIPENCQLWTASHSYGFIDYAREAAHAAIIDFDSLDFDVPQVLVPEPKNSLDVFDVAVPKERIFKLFDNKQIVLCENQNDEFYNLLALEDKLFVGVKNKDEVFLNIKRDPRYYGLIDRDFLTDHEVASARRKHSTLRILHYYCFENYLYHPDNIAEVNPTFDKASYIQEIVAQKNSQKLKLISRIDKIRNSYAILRSEDTIRDENFDTIIDALASDDLERFYPFFDMKKNFNKKSIEIYNWRKEQLVSTSWFEQKIREA